VRTRWKLYARRVAAVLGVFMVVQCCDVSALGARRNAKSRWGSQPEAVHNLREPDYCFEGVGKSWTAAPQCPLVVGRAVQGVLSFVTTLGTAKTVRPVTSLRVKTNRDRGVSDVHLLSPCADRYQGSTSSSRKSYAGQPVQGGTSAGRCLSPGARPPALSHPSWIDRSPRRRQVRLGYEVQRPGPGAPRHCAGLPGGMPARNRWPSVIITSGGRPMSHRRSCCMFRVCGRWWPA